MPRIRRNTIAEVAQRAAVSPTTVSHALSGNRPVAIETRIRVQRAIDELGYRPSGIARSLRLQRSDTIALIVPDIANPFYPAFARGIDAALDGRYLTFVCSTDARRDTELRFIKDLRDRQVDGMIIASFATVMADLEPLLDAGVPLVALGARLQDPRLDIVTTDDEHGAYLATEHLVGRGHRRIALIGGPDGGGDMRHAGYRRALEAAGRPYRPELVVSGRWVRAGGAEAMRRLLDLDEPPTAVFAANDLMAIGAVDAIHDRGLSVPGDVALVGYDDIEAAALVSPALTTVVNPADEAGREAGHLLLDRMTGRHERERRVVRLRSRLVIRDSS